eukprot:COSAG02_NODE_8669_length_2486_cov_1.986594_3_plen_246_part_00
MLAILHATRARARADARACARTGSESSIDGSVVYRAPVDARCDLYTMAEANRRLVSLRTHLVASPVAANPSAEKQEREHSSPPMLLDDATMKEFVKRGIVLIPPDAAGMPPLNVHDANWADGCALQEDADAGIHSIGDNIVAGIPGIRQVLESAAVRGVLQSVLGEGYTYHPHHFMHMTSPQTDQFWHKDSGTPSVCNSHRLVNDTGYFCGCAAPLLPGHSRRFTIVLRLCNRSPVGWPEDAPPS